MRYTAAHKSAGTCHQYLFNLNHAAKVRIISEGLTHLLDLSGYGVVGLLIADFQARKYKGIIYMFTLNVQLPLHSSLRQVFALYTACATFSHKLHKRCCKSYK